MRAQLALLGFLALTTLSLPPVLGESQLFQVSERSRARQPGEVLLLTLSTDTQFQSVRVKGLGREFRGYQSEPGMWQVLVGIDLNLKPGSQELQLVGILPDGSQRGQSYPLEIEDKHFPTRRLTVDPKYVNPPRDQLDRIQRESRRLSGIFSSVSDGPLWQGGFQSPVPGLETSGFGKRSILNGQPRSPHSGADFDADVGTPAHSPNRGKVVLVDDLYYTGQTVVVDHGLGLYSLFAHLSKFNVEVGQEVEPGDVIGLVGATGRVTGPHLHWTVRLATARVDPMSLVEVTAEP